MTMATAINKVAVLGAGVMGQGIAAHLANAGIPSVLYDIVPRDLPDGQPRSKLAIDGLKNAVKMKPAAFFEKGLAKLVTPANYDDDAALLAECDLVIEVVVERLDIKTKVYEWVAAHRRPDCIVASNTSGLQLSDMAASMSQDMREHFLIMHFFNPVRYMRLLELVGGPDTKPDVLAAVAQFGEEKLGKGIVYAKDTPNFIANRIGTYGMISVFKHMQEMDFSIEDVDTALGKAAGRPKLGVFALCDLVGLDTIDHVLGNVRDNCPDDGEAASFVSPDFLKKMVADGFIGNKSGKGFYQRTKDRDPKGRRIVLARDWRTGEYAPKARPRFDSVKQALSFADDPALALRALLRGDDNAAQFAWKVTADSLLYTARRVPEIADDIVNIDRAMRWGFSWDLGPFEAWDAIGVAESTARMQADGLDVPAWVVDMLEKGRTSFYARDGGVRTYWDPTTATAKPMPDSDAWLWVGDVKASNGQVAHNDAAELIDLGDGALLLQFTKPSQMNALEEGMFQMYNEAIDRLENDEFAALVIGSQSHFAGQFRPSVGPSGQAFCAGANLMMVGMAAMQGQWDQVDTMISGMQDTLQRSRYCSKPVVTAPYALTLGGGLEVAMQSDGTVSAGEVYMGLVEAGMGLLPAGGGCKEMVRRYLGDIPAAVNADPNPFIQAAFMNIGLAKVSTSAAEAREMLYLRPTDRVAMDADRLIHDAKTMALGLAAGGYVPPARATFKMPGASGRSTIELKLHDLKSGGFATEHDAVVAQRVAYVLTGGDIPAGTRVDEQHILDLEREGFLSLLGTEKTQARIMHFISSGKILRN
jgi:3-hydroxyacyl-CoA dehydrogenase